MLTEDQDITGLFDEFYFIPESPPIRPVKENEIIKKTIKEFQFVGGNKKKVLFIYDQKDQLVGNDLLLIENLVTKAIGWTMDDIVLFNLSQNEQTTMQDIKNYFNPSSVLVWGCADFLASNAIPQKLHEVLSGKTLKVLAVHPIDMYHVHPDLKKALWPAIQNLLELK
jgi:hypothetical protein